MGHGGGPEEEEWFSISMLVDEFHGKFAEHFVCVLTRVVLPVDGASCFRGFVEGVFR